MAGEQSDGGSTLQKQTRTSLRHAPSWALLGALLGLALYATPLAQASRTLNVYDEGHLHYLHSSGDELIDDGHATGSVPGTVVVHFTYNGNPTVYASFQIYAHGGTITGYATGHLSNPASTSPSFSGALRLSGGGGHYAHAHGSGELYGVFYRRNYAMTVQTRGSLRY